MSNDTFTPELQQALAEDLRRIANALETIINLLRWIYLNTEPPNPPA